MTTDQKKPAYIVEPLGKHHDRSSFTCGVEVLDRYLQRQASQDVKRRVAATFVLVEIETGEIAGFYTLSSYAVPTTLLPEEITKKLPRYDVTPATLLGRLATSTKHRGRGLGRSLLANALRHCLKQSKEVASFAVVVNAKDQAAIDFYEHFGFRSFFDREDRLFLPMETIKRELEKA